MALRAFSVLILSIGVASYAAARDLCLQIDIGPLSGSALVFENVKTRGGPIQGYLAEYENPELGYRKFSPLAGEAIVSAADGRWAIGVTRFLVNINAGGPTATELVGASSAFGLLCDPGTNRQIGILDTCTGRIEGQGSSLILHVIDCHDVPPVP